MLEDSPKSRRVRGGFRRRELSLKRPSYFQATRDLSGRNVTLRDGRPPATASIYSAAEEKAGPPYVFRRPPKKDVQTKG